MEDDIDAIWSLNLLVRGTEASIGFNKFNTIHHRPEVFFLTSPTIVQDDNIVTFVHEQLN
jgi:hypothetical protein